MGTRKNGRARRRHARGEGAPAQKAPENSFPPPIYWQPLRDLSKVLTENDRPRTNKACRQKAYPRSKYTCYKDQLGYLIIERWSNKLMVNTQL